MTFRHSFSAPLHSGVFQEATSKRDYNRLLFDVVALRYDVVTRLLSFGWDRWWKHRLMRRIGLTNVAVAVDVATGTGDLARRIRRRFPEADVVGVDLSAEMLKRARRGTVESASKYPPSSPRLRFAYGDMSALPLQDATADLVTGGYALRNAPNLEETIAEIRRILRPGGRCAFLDFSNGGAGRRRILGIWGRFWGLLLNHNRDTYGYIAESLAAFPTPTQLRSHFEAAGFVQVRRLSLFFGFLDIIEARAR